MNVQSDIATAEFRQPPHNLQLEQALLGAILINNETLERVSGLLKSDHFFDPLHQSVFEAIMEFSAKGKVANPITLRPVFESVPDVSPDVSAVQYLGTLAGSATTIINARNYAQEIVNLATLRSLILIGEDVVNAAFDTSTMTEPQALIEDAEAKLFAIAEKGRNVRDEVTFEEASLAAVREICEAYQRGGKLSGMSTGYRSLDAKTGGLHKSDLIILAGRPSMGKAQPVDAPVLTEDGWRPIGELRLGDKLASIDGAQSRVVGVFPQGKKQIYRVTFSDGRSAECCGEHLWRVHHRKWLAPKILSSMEIQHLLEKPSMRRRLWIDTPSGHFGHSDALPVDPWVLGALIGNGCMTSGTVRFSTSSTHTLYELKRAVGSDYRVTQAGSYDFRVVSTDGPQNRLRQALKGLGLWGLTSERKFIPAVYKTANRDARLALVRGLLDTDGWTEKHGSLRFATSSSALARDFSDLIRSLGGICTINEKAPKYTYRGQQKEGLRSFVCNVMHDNPAELLGHPGKKARAHTERRKSRLTIVDIAPTRVADAVCIQVTHPRYR